MFLKTLPLVIIIRLSTFYYFKLFRGIWKYASINDLKIIFQAVTSGSILIVFGITYIFHFYGFPRSVFIIDWLLVMLLVGGSRFAYRLFQEIYPFERIKGKKVLIIGAGDAGEMILREIRNNPKIQLNPVGFIDDDPKKRDLRIRDIPVLGTINELETIAVGKGIEEIIIAIPSTSGKQMRKIIRKCRDAGVKFKTIPGIGDLINGRVNINEIREVNEADLLRREVVEIDSEKIATEITQRNILVTGACGSIGSELCRQICRLKPQRLILFDKAENGLYHMEWELQESFPKVEIIPLVGDILDQVRVSRVLEEFRPEIIFHSAAYKHVPMMESNPLEAIKNNLLGTRNIALACEQYRVAKMVLISTDKAVNPCNIMGASKRGAELFVQCMSQNGVTKFVTVRFGNVLNSDGSVVPRFKRQIATGGPVTVTHPEIYRYFMTIPEAAQLVLQAGSMGQGGEIFILDMGEPIKIVELAEDLIALSGLKSGEDIEIIFTGLRPGDKLYEELLNPGEVIKPTYHKKIMIAEGAAVNDERLKRMISELEELTQLNDTKCTIDKLKEIVPEFKSQAIM
ncbi:MAG: polysaccharide biosynthesis protein [Deltaproteobacteria bacterium]|nr:MAG: polysaccharide biosynthesis protein [Deltaproteobacteria bacterium]